MRVVLAAALAVAPALASACPACARDTTSDAALIIGALILAPYVVAGVVVRALRRAGGAS
jgi:hypothetical protein